MAALGSPILSDNFVENPLLFSYTEQHCPHFLFAPGPLKVSLNRPHNARDIRLAEMEGGGLCPIHSYAASKCLLANRY